MNSADFAQHERPIQRTPPGLGQMSNAQAAHANRALRDASSSRRSFRLTVSSAQFDLSGARCDRRRR
jgi:hypothetical protein